MKQFVKLLIFMCLFFIPTVSAKELTLEGESFTIFPLKTISLDLIVDADTDIQSGSFTITSSSKKVLLDKITFVDDTTYTVNGNTYQFTVKGGIRKKLATITLKASSNLQNKEKVVILLSDFQIKDYAGKVVSFNPIAQEITCTNETIKSANNMLKEVKIGEYLFQDFSKEQLEYTIALDTDISTAVVQAIPADAKASIRIEEPAIKDGKVDVKIIVTAENAEERNYIFHITSKNLENSYEQETIVRSYQKKWLFITIFLVGIIVCNLFLLRKEK